MAQVDVESLRVVNGVIDLDAIEVLEQPFGDTNAALRQMSAALASARSPWLVAPIGDRVDQLGDEIDELVEQTDRAVAAVQLAPSMLGRDGPRTYFVAFTTPAEARGLGGFMGTWAELHADDGRLEVIRTGQTAELTGAMGAARPVLDGPADYLARYGRFGAGVDGEPVAVDFWSNVTMSPDFPSVTEVFAQLYPASGGREIDGAIALDVETIARFLELTGPVQVEGPEGTIRLTSGDAVQYLLRDQYAEIADDDDARRRARGDHVATDQRRLRRRPARSARTCRDARAGDGARAGWSSGPGIRKISRCSSASGSPAISRRPTGTASRSSARTAAPTSSTPTCAAASATTPIVDEDTGRIQAAVTIRLANDAPTDLPADAGGNPFGLPPGTNRQYLSVYSPWELTAAELDGEATGMEPGRELGWNVFSRFVDIPPGGEVELRLGFAGALPTDAPYTLTLRSQPLTYPDVVRIDVRTTDGDVAVAVA